MKNRAINIVTVIVAGIAIAISLVLGMTGTISQTVMFVIMGIAVAGLLAVLAFVNYKTSSYGGKFHERYPDAH